MQQMYLTIQTPISMLLAINIVSIFWLEIMSSVLVGTLVVVWYVWPSLIKMPRYSALIPLIFVHAFRYVGMTLLVPYMYDQKLPRDYLNDAAYGDLLTAALAIASIFALRGKSRIAIPLVWIFNTIGFVDLINGLKSLIVANVPAFNLGTIWYVYTYYAPVVLLSHLMIYWILIKPKDWERYEYGN